MTQEVDPVEYAAAFEKKLAALRPALPASFRKPARTPEPSFIDDIEPDLPEEVVHEDGTPVGLEDAGEIEYLDHRGVKYIEGLLSKLADKLRVTKGSRDDTTFQVSCRLREVVNSDWNDLTETQAEAFLLANAPIGTVDGDTFSEADVRKKWANSKSDIGGKTVPRPFDLSVRETERLRKEGTGEPISPKASGAQMTKEEYDTEAAENTGETGPSHEEISAEIIELALSAGSPAFELDGNNPKINWKHLVTPGSFLDIYMQTTTKDDAPEEFHFGNALQALGLAVGRSVALADTYPVRPNLFNVLVGPTGARKSTAIKHMKSTIEKALPYDEDPSAVTNRGVDFLSGINSGEMVIKQFQRTIDSGGTGKGCIGPVRALVEYEELEALTAKANQSGSSLKPVLISVFDCGSPLSTMSVSGGRRFAPHHYGALVTSVQNDRLSKLMSGGDITSGFLNRFLFWYGTLKPQNFDFNQVFDMTEPADKLALIHLWAKGVSYSTDPIHDPDSPSYVRDFEFHLQVEADAMDLWGRFADGTIRPIKDKAQEDKNDILARIDLFCKKLMLIFAINDLSKTVKREHVEKMTYLFPYVVWCQTHGSEGIGLSENTVGENEVLEVIQSLMSKKNTTKMAVACQKRGGVTGADIKRQRKKLDTSKVNYAIEQMAKAGILVEVVNPSAKRNKVSYAPAP